MNLSPLATRSIEFSLEMSRHYVHSNILRMNEPDPNETVLRIIRIMGHLVFAAIPGNGNC
jgi:hypothetical protein